MTSVAANLRWRLTWKLAKAHSPIHVEESENPLKLDERLTQLKAEWGSFLRYEYSEVVVHDSRGWSSGQ